MGITHSDSSPHLPTAILRTPFQLLAEVLPEHKSKNCGMADRPNWREPLSTILLQTHLHRTLSSKVDFLLARFLSLIPRCNWNENYLSLLLLLSRFSRVRLCATPETAAHQAPPPLGFSRQEHWSGLPFPSPMQESEK